MNVNDFLSTQDMTIGNARPSMVRRVMQEGETVGPDIGYEITGKPDQRLTLRQALKLIGCEETK